MTETTIKDIRTIDIVFDAGTQARVGTDTKTCQAYIESMQDGVEFPPLDVFNDGSSEKYILADGFHRLQSHCSFRPNEPIKCRVHLGTVADAQWFAITANKTHGLRRTNDDKRKAVKMALLHPLGAEKSTRQLSEEIGVSHQTVHNIRTELASTVKSLQSSKRTGQDGRTIDTANIGTKRQHEHLNEPPEPESNIRTNANGKTVNIKGFDYRYHRRCDQCALWSLETGLCARDNSRQCSWQPACCDFHAKSATIPPIREPEVERLQTRPVQRPAQNSKSQTSSVRRENVLCKLYPDSAELTAVEIRHVTSEDFLRALQKAIEQVLDED